jgi:hypothetical protein
MLNILVCGTSIALPVSWGQKTWVHYLKQQLNCEIVNLSRVGCGSQYIHDSVITEVIERNYDLVIVSWNSFNNILEVRSRIKQKIFDWDIIGGNPHAEYLQSDWIWNHVPDHAIEDELDVGIKRDFFNAYLNLGQGDHETGIKNTLVNVISLQNTLKALDLPYMFTFPRKLLRLKRHEHYHKLVDWSLVDDHHLYTDARRMRHWENNHPTEAAYQWYADEVYQFLSTKNLIKT